MKFFKVISITIVCLILGTVVAMQYRSVKTNQSMAVYEQKRSTELITDLIREQKNRDQLEARIDELQKEIKTYSENTTQTAGSVEALKNEVRKYRILAGLETVKGKGLMITIDNSDTGIVDDSNIMEVLNDLRSADVQAMSVNDERIVATSEVQRAGSYIMVNGRKLLPPYVIKAIGDPVKMEKTLNFLGGAIETLELYGLRVAVKQEENIIIPAVRDDGTVLRMDMLTAVE